MIKTLKDTVELMKSPDYRDRFVAEYKQLVIRYKGLRNMKVNYGNVDTTKMFCKKEITCLSLDTKTQDFGKAEHWSANQ